MTQFNTFNLIDEPWIPISGKDHISLKELFSNPDYVELGGNPIVKISLMKILLAIVQAAYTPEDEEDLKALSIEKMSEKCLSYINEWYDVFWLYGKQPFLQMPEIKAIIDQKNVKESVKNYGTFSPEIASGNNTILHQSQVEVPLSEANKALMLVTLMGFTLGGKQANNSISLAEGYSKNKTGKPGTHLGRTGYLHSFLFGKNILTTLWLNLFTKEKVDQLGYIEGLGRPVWENMPSTECCSTAKILSNSYLGRLVPLSKFYFLADNGLYYSDGIPYHDPKDGGTDPMMMVNEGNKEIKVVGVNPGKRPWRWLTGMLSFLSNQDCSWSCRQIENGLDRARDECSFAGIWSGGLKVGNKAGEQKPNGLDDYVESAFFLPIQEIGEKWFISLSAEMKELEELSISLSKSITQYFEIQKMMKPKQSKQATFLFWELAEKEFQVLLDSCMEEETTSQKNIRNNFAKIVIKVFDRFCPMNTGRQLDSWTQSRATLLKKINKYLKK